MGWRLHLAEDGTDVTDNPDQVEDAEHNDGYYWDGFARTEAWEWKPDADLNHAWMVLETFENAIDAWAELYLLRAPEAIKLICDVALKYRGSAR